MSDKKKIYPVEIELTENFLEKNPTIKGFYENGKFNIPISENIPEEKPVVHDEVELRPQQGHEIDPGVVANGSHLSPGWIPASPHGAVATDLGGGRERGTLTPWPPRAGRARSGPVPIARPGRLRPLPRPHLPLPRL